MELEVLFSVVVYLSIFTAAIAVVLGLIQHSQALKLIILLTLVSFIFDLSLEIGYQFFGFIYKYHGALYRAVEFILISEFFYYTLLKTKRRTNYIFKTGLQIAILSFIVIVFGFSESSLRTASSLIFLACTLAYFAQMTRNMDVMNPIDYPLFWINASILIYFSGSLFLFLVFQPLADLNKNTANFSYIFHNILGITKNILIGVGFWKSMKNPGWETNMVNLKN